MFYSHTLLARKTPLGTVWCAAHLQHRLNKKDYEKTKIPVVVDAIMFGEVPLALRTSSYLLLGVVRIYSKQIDYLKHDVDVLVMELRKMHMHASAILTLPENVYQAPFYSITLPRTFDLDALELDSDIYHDGVPDTHMRNQEEITLADQIYIGRDAYLNISFDEDVMHDSTHLGEFSDLGFTSMEDDMIPLPHVDTTMNVEVPSVNEDVLNMKHDRDNMPQSFPEVEVLDAMNVQDFGPSNQSICEGDDSPQNVPERESQREDVPEFSTVDVPTVPPLGGDVITESHSLIDENINQVNLLPMKEDKTTPPRTLLPYEQSAGPPTSASAPEAFRESSVELVLQPTPQQPRPRSRKRKQFFDKSTVLTNKFMKKALEDSSDVLRERRNIPSSYLEVWKLNNKLRKTEVFYHPSITGLCNDLSDIFNVNYIATKCRTTSLEEALEDLGDARNVASTTATFSGQVDAPSPAPEVASTPHTGIPTTPAGNIPPAGETFLPPIVAPSPDAASSPRSRIPPTGDPASASYSDMEIEHPRDVEGNRGDDILEDLVASPKRPMPSPRHSEYLGSPSRTISSTGMMFTPGPVSTEPSRSMFETPKTIDEGLGAEDLTLSDKQIGTGDEDLYFLEADSSPAGKSKSQGTHGVDSLSVRTRAVGRYLRSLSPITSISDDSTQDLSLNGILEGKRRKLCARMFYETLVLKSYGLIDVQQDVPYGDITLKLTTKLSMAQI